MSFYRRRVSTTFGAHPSSLVDASVNQRVTQLFFGDAFKQLHDELNTFFNKSNITAKGSLSLKVGTPSSDNTVIPARGDESGTGTSTPLPSNNTSPSRRLLNSSLTQILWEGSLTLPNTSTTQRGIFELASVTDSPSSEVVEEALRKASSRVKPPHASNDNPLSGFRGIGGDFVESSAAGGQSGDAVSSISQKTVDLDSMLQGQRTNSAVPSTTALKSEDSIPALEMLEEEALDATTFYALRPTELVGEPVEGKEKTIIDDLMSAESGRRIARYGFFRVESLSSGTRTNSSSKKSAAPSPSDYTVSYESMNTRDGETTTVVSASGGLIASYYRILNWLLHTYGRTRTMSEFEAVFFREGPGKIIRSNPSDPAVLEKRLATILMNGSGAKFRDQVGMDVRFVKEENAHVGEVTLDIAGKKRVIGWAKDKKSAKNATALALKNAIECSAPGNFSLQGLKVNPFFKLNQGPKFVHPLAREIPESGEAVRRLWSQHLGMPLQEPAKPMHSTLPSGYLSTLHNCLERILSIDREKRVQITVAKAPKGNFPRQLSLSTNDSAETFSPHVLSILQVKSPNILRWPGKLSEAPEPFLQLAMCRNALRQAIKRSKELNLDAHKTWIAIPDGLEKIGENGFLRSILPTQIETLQHLREMLAALFGNLVAPDCWRLLFQVSPNGKRYTTALKFKSEKLNKRFFPCHGGRLECLIGYGKGDSMEDSISAMCKTAAHRLFPEFYDAGNHMQNFPLTPQLAILSTRYQLEYPLPPLGFHLIKTIHGNNQEEVSSEASEGVIDDKIDRVLAKSLQISQYHLYLRRYTERDVSAPTGAKWSRGGFSALIISKFEKAAFCRSLWVDQPDARYPAGAINAARELLEGNNMGLKSTLKALRRSTAKIPPEFLSNDSKQPLKMGLPLLALLGKSVFGLDSVTCEMVKYEGKPYGRLNAALGGVPITWSTVGLASSGLSDKTVEMIMVRKKLHGISDFLPPHLRDSLLPVEDKYLAKKSSKDEGPNVENKEGSPNSTTHHGSKGKRVTADKHLSLEELLSQCLKRDSSEFRLEESQQSGVCTVRLFSIPVLAGGTLDFRNEKEIHQGKGVRKATTKNMACYAVLQKSYPTVLAEAVRSNPKLIEQIY